MNEPRYLTTAEAATYLRFASPKAFRQFLSRHEVPVLRRGRLLLFDRMDLDAWLRDPSMTRPAIAIVRKRRA
jgi:excisionase family DNA binding protein